ncbi:hypothetical protein K439DRAFT_1097610 [Ramaria rubella]|nr:hypothetical protein K439DRAFT_1097610 [Ramaria rubella]
MLASLHPNSPTSDQAVKDLIDHRARASHTRYSSVSFSQRSDSPSIYSRGDYSPGAQYRPSADWPSGRPSYAYSVAGQSAFDDAEDHIHNPFARSSFDHDDESSRAADDDDCVSFISALTPKIAVPPASDPPDTRNVELDADSPPSEDIDDDPRMSILGPKMRFVSKAPWELGDDDLLEEDEEDSGGAAEALTMFSHRMSNWRNREHDKSSAKSLGLRSNSPAPSLPDKKNPSTFSMGLQHQTTGPLREGPYGNHLTGASQSHSAIQYVVGVLSR